jgi:uncharacterized membrane protein YtjA (UPF0391 family)
MLRWALMFLIVTLLAAFLGFYQLQGVAMWAAQIAFFVFLVLFVVSLVFGRGTPRELT